MEPKDISCLGSSGFKSRWKGLGVVCLQHKTMAGVGCGATCWPGHGAQAFSLGSRLFSLTVSYKSSGLHDACWFQAVWDALEHLSSLSSCGFPTLWDDSILFCVVRKAEGQLGLLFSAFRMWLCVWSLWTKGLELRAIVERGECQWALAKSKEGSHKLFPQFHHKHKQGRFPQRQQKWTSMFDPNQHVGWDFDNLGMKYFNLPRSRSIFVSG